MNYICIIILQKSSEVMENIIEQLEQDCKKNGTTITEVCRRADVSRSVVVRWKNETPKSFQIYWSLKNALNSIIQEQSKPTE